MEFISLAEPNPHIKIWELTQFIAIPSELLIAFPTDHQGGMAQCISMGEKIAEPSMPRTIFYCKIHGCRGQPFSLCIDKLRRAENGSAARSPVQHFGLKPQLAGLPDIIRIDHRQIGALSLFIKPKASCTSSDVCLAGREAYSGITRKLLHTPRCWLS